jgi:hypothetical protein
LTKSEYLDEVRLNLAVLPKDEVDMAIRFYDEYLSDAGRGNEAAAMEELGKPYHLAKSIISEQSAFTRSAMYIEHKQNRNIAPPESIFTYAEPDKMTYPNVKRAQPAEPEIRKPEKVKITKDEGHDPISKRAFILAMTAIICGTILLLVAIPVLMWTFR